jgi:C-8 sterol isomerase
VGRWIRQGLTGEELVANIFDPDTLQDICRKNLGLPLEEKLEAITDDLDKQYPNRIRRKKTWVFKMCGGSLGMLTIMYASITEYLVIFGSPTGSEGYTGRYHWSHVYDILLDGEMRCYARGQFEPAVYKPGDMAFLRKGYDKGYRMKDHTWMLEYCRGLIPTMLLFGVLGSLLQTMDFKSARQQFWDFSRIAIRELLRGKI